jgi:hypothetical protein
MKYILRTKGFVHFGASPALGGICQGDFLCYLFLSVIFYLPYFLVLTAISFIVLAVFRPTTSFSNKLMYSIFLSFILILFYHNFLSIWIEKQKLVNSYKQYLSQLDYELYEPTYVPKGYLLYETRVDNGHLSFYYDGNEPGQFAVTEFKNPKKIDLSPPVCQIGGFFLQQDDFEIREYSGFASSVYGNCQKIKTPKGISVSLMTYNLYSEEKLAAFILKNTLITISAYDFTDQELRDLIDGLEEKNASDIDFKVINRTIGR